MNCLLEAIQVTTGYSLQANLLSKSTVTLTGSVGVVTPACGHVQRSSTCQIQHTLVRAIGQLVPLLHGLRTCFRKVYNVTACNSAFYPLAYNRVCGRVIAYQSGTMDAFQGVISGGSIDGVYLDGVSITHGSEGSRQHAWSFTSAVGEHSSFANLFPSSSLCD